MPVCAQDGEKTQLLKLLASLITVYTVKLLKWHFS